MGKLKFLFEVVVDVIAFWLKQTDCRHVVSRVMQGKRVLIVRCAEPSHPGCQLGYCSMHCDEICNCASNGPEGDEDDIEPPTVWTPKADIQGRTKVEA